MKELDPEISSREEAGVDNVRVIQCGTHPFNPLFVPLAATTNKGAVAFMYKMQGINHIRQRGA